ERLLCKQEARSSILLTSILLRPSATETMVGLRSNFVLLRAKKNIPAKLYQCFSLRRAKQNEAGQNE
ncbi:MAG: hypothetical protein HYS56_04690, partial [Candidatus Omnitrophica bacterium]|nr:hypothetical protein [Candidatus Omnitrophota bacterium]